MSDFPDVPNLIVKNVPKHSEASPCDTPYLHLYPQDQWHGDAYIVANTKGLEVLRSAIDHAIKTGRGEAEAFVSDGEGYDALVVKVDDLKLAVPYDSKDASEKTEGAVWPWDIKVDTRKNR